MKSHMNRRSFISSTAAVTAFTALGGIFAHGAAREGSMVGFRAAPIERVRAGFIGTGNRGMAAIARWLTLEGVQPAALCDVRPEKVAAAQRLLAAKNIPPAKEFTRGPDDWKRLCETMDLDLVYICTPWNLHAPLCVHAMRCGKHVATEVPAAITLQECWDLVKTAEHTRKHCMMLENCCYGETELMLLNMCRQGLLGELVHGDTCYIHDIRDLKFTQGDQGNPWRLQIAQKLNGNLYPTHGLGPMARYMSINRGDRFEYLTSMSSAQRGLTLYARKRHGADSSQARAHYRMGDMNTTIIRTARGRTISIQYDTTSPRPPTRLNTVVGTNGTYTDPPARLALEPNGTRWIEGQELADYRSKYQHPLWIAFGEAARKAGGHGGMDQLMEWRLVRALQQGLPLDQDVYDAATWSCIVPLSCKSVAKNGDSIEVPDFTRGMWRSHPRQDLEI